MIDVLNLSKKYGERYAIRDLSFSIQKGEVVGLLGPNGAGKSTTMKILTGFMSPTGGIAKVCGYDVFEEPFEVKRKIGYLPETPPLYPEMTVEDYLSYAARLKDVRKQNLKSYVDESLQKTLLTDVRRRMIKNLSKGFQQRVGIAQSIVSKPEVLILDEPTVGLDPKQVSEMRELIKSLRSEHTIVLSTHILSEVEATCSKIIIIHQGRIVAQDQIENVHRLHRSKKLITVRVKTDTDLTPSFSALSLVTRAERTSPHFFQLELANDDAAVEQVLELILNCRAGLIELATDRHNLEQAFLSLTYDQVVPATTGTR